MNSPFLLPPAASAEVAATSSSPRAAQLTSARLLAGNAQQVAPENGVVVTRALLLLLGAVEMPLTLKVLKMVAVTAGSALLVWRCALSPREKSLLGSLLRGNHAAG